MHRRITIHGDGIAACCCAQLLGQHRYEVSWAEAARRTGPTLLINRSTQALLTDVFPHSQDLFSDLPVIRKRIVLWGNEPEAKVFPHAGVVISENVLIERLRVGMPVHSSFFSDEADWSIYSLFGASHGDQQHFGSRMANAVPVRLKTRESDACWIESLDSGWLFLLPNGGGEGSLLAIGGPLAMLFEESRLIAGEIEEIAGLERQFAAYPRILDPLCGAGWMACGGAAMSFDPICGEGSGNAVREAILASAVVRLAASAGNAGDGLAHYSSRLLAGFLRHLDICMHFYAAGARSDWWDSEAAALRSGIDWTRRKLSCLPQPRYRLVGFGLEPC